MSALNFPASPADGDTYAAAGRTWKWSAATSSWNTVANGLPYRQTIVTSGSQASVHLTGFPADGGRAEMRVSNGRSTDTVGSGTFVAGEVNLRVQFNGDTAAHYTSGNTNTNGVGTQTSGGATSTSGTIGVLANSHASNAAGDGGAIAMDILGYAGSTRYKHVLGQYSFVGQADGVPFNTGYAGCVWLATAAITDILLFPEAGAWVDGSVIELIIWD